MSLKMQRKRLKKRVATLEHLIASVQLRIGALATVVARMRSTFDRPEVSEP